MPADINKLDPKLRQLAEALKQEVKKKLGKDIIFTQTLRTTAEQNALYAQGRTKPGKKVTNARGGYSYHNYGLAFDFAFSGPKPYEGDFPAVGRIGKALGLEWGGDWPAPMRDMPHFQYTYGLTIKQLLAGKRPAKPVSQPINNQKPMARIVKESIGKGVGLFIPAVSEADFIELAKKFGVVIPTKAPGKVDWAKVEITGEVKFIK